MSHERIHTHDGRAPAAPLASARNAVRRVPAPRPWLWMARSASAASARAVCLVLLDALSALLLATGAEVVSHG
ncbi:MAG: hypothetical protein K2Y42_19095 [Hyphomicrobium sp.]|nr:hypothetical protein [Hyphomicrobium sp.]